MVIQIYSVRKARNYLERILNKNPMAWEELQERVLIDNTIKIKNKWNYLKFLKKIIINTDVSHKIDSEAYTGNPEFEFFISLENKNTTIANDYFMIYRYGLRKDLFSDEILIGLEKDERLMDKKLRKIKERNKEIILW